ncbi:MAG: hypothetical protein OEY87_01605 [Gammaproteobacteria bacterium]|nr:hypothetical protein [Gammaproteobacteria bacterium]
MNTPDKVPDPSLNSTDRWDWLAIIFHWLTAIIVVGIFIFGLWMTDLTYYHAWYTTAPELLWQ